MATVQFGNWLTTFADEAGSIQGTGASIVTLSDGLIALQVNDPGTNQGAFKVIGQGPLGAFNNPNFNVVNNYMRFYVQPEGFPASGSEMFYNITSISDLFKSNMRFNSSGNVQLYDSFNNTGNLLWQSTNALALGTWYRIESLIGTGTHAPYEVNIALGDGDFFETTAGAGDFRTTGGFEAAFGKDVTISNQTMAANFRDFLWSDSGYPGPGHSVLLAPSADGFYVNGTPNGAAARWQCVDEVPRDDDLTYINGLSKGRAYTAQTGGVISGTINCVKAYARGKSDTGAGITYNVRLRSGLVDVDTSALGVGNPTYINRQKIFDRDPSTGLPWTSAGVNAAQPGFIQNTAAAVRVTAIYLLVDYLPATAPAATNPEIWKESA